MHVPTDRWTEGGWNSKLPQFRRLAEALGVEKTPITPEDLQDLFKRVATAKLFADNVQPFIDATTGFRGSAADLIENIERKLGTAEPLPFMSMAGVAVPAEFNGVAIWPTGTTNWTKLRLEQVETAFMAGARFRRIICTHSSRICSGPADRKHPLIADIPEGEEPTEQALQQQLAEASWLDDDLFYFAELPEFNDDGKPVSLEQQLNHMKNSGQYDEVIAGADIYVPSTPNSLYVPLHVRRVLGHDDVWFSQAGARLVRGASKSWWPALQDVMTLPQGMLRLWVELVHAGCITE
jgi:hypothetical protein